MTATTTPPCVIRFQKLSSWKAVRHSARHTWRTDDVPHVDSSRTHLNQDWRPVSTPGELAGALQSRLSCLTKEPSLRAVMCLEFLVTARREAFTEHGGQTDASAYFRDALAFLEERHGSENVLAVNVQRDEKSPHLVVYIVPIVERQADTVRRSVFASGYDENGRQRRQYRHFAVRPQTVLSAWHFYGTPAQTTALQSDFAYEVAERHGLARGLEMSAATHTTNTAYQAAKNRAFYEHAVVTQADLTRRRAGLKRESPKEMAARLSGLVQEHYAPIVASAATAEHDRRRGREMVETARRHRARYREARAELERFTHELTPEQCEALASQAASMRRENHQREAERRADEERAARREQEAAQRAREAEARHLDAEVSQWSGITPEALAQLSEEDRVRGWRILRGTPGLELDFERAYGSGLFDEWGRLNKQLDENHAPQAPERYNDPVNAPVLPESNPDTPGL